MIVWSAFLLGLFGSLHCAGMCGPLALALPAGGRGHLGLVSGRAAYNLGRITTYACLGVAAGIVGRAFVLAGLQRWASTGAGVLILSSLLVSSRYGLELPFAPAVAWLKSGLSWLLRQRSLPAFYLLGTLNGLLPCGLVYVACAGALATGGLRSGVVYMLAFGAGTVPIILAVSCVGGTLHVTLRSKLQRLVPVCVLVVGLLLIVRGMSLGIPFLSPHVATANSSTQSCH